MRIDWVPPTQSGCCPAGQAWTTESAGEGGNRKRNRGRETEGGKRQRSVRSKGERMEARDALASSQRSGPAHPGLKTEMEGRGCRQGADLLDLWKTAP